MSTNHVLLVCGSRTWVTPELVRLQVETLDLAWAKWPGLRTVHGQAPEGSDLITHAWAVARGSEVKTFAADWSVIPGLTKTVRESRKHGKYDPMGGIRRNQQMLEHLLECQAHGSTVCVLGFWDGKSRGTKHMLDIAKEAGVLRKIVRPPVPETDEQDPFAA